MRLTTACLVAFAGFLRFSKLIEFITLRADAMVIKIPCSKGDQLRKGDEVIIARSGKVTCPVSYLENFLSRSGTSLQEQRFVFHPICKSKTVVMVQYLVYCDYRDTPSCDNYIVTKAIL